ncbi:PucR family transcriptional regulator [Nocardia veterana]|uniref:PucR family transcriptional regulator n=1 Tax=Nocardia veterana TaxID=132249 RepID=A0A7X6M1Z1_9NOCA|nr:PucR family transcriptional regulator [Nocardia veterana]NKY87882.1 PucR family transcriptional regulator [Nocardia veterana]
MSDVDAEVVGALRERACALVAGFSPEVPAYSQLPSALSEAEFVRGARLNVEMFFDFLSSGELPTAAAMTEVVDLALKRVRQGVPLASVLARYRIAAGYMVAELERSASPAERAVIASVGPGLMEFVAAVTARVAVACVEHVSDPLWEQRDRRRAIADALLQGRDPRDGSPEAVVPVASSYAVAVFDVATTADPARLTRIRTALDRIDGAFLRMDSAGWTVLIPLDGTVEQVASAVQRTVTADRCDSVPQMWIGIACATTLSGIPEAARQARAVSDICRRTGRPEAVTSVREVLLEYALTGGPSARRYLSSVVAALRDHPVLLRTLDAYFACQFNQLATARRLGVHRNTVTYRLAGIAEATGWDPLNPRAAMVLYAARLTAASAD